MRSLHAVMLLAIMFPPIAAQALPTVVTESCIDNNNLTCVSRIDGLGVTDMVFNVTFETDSYANIFTSVIPFFLDDETGASIAADAIMAALNTAGFAGVHGDGQSIGSWVLVPYGLEKDLVFSERRREDLQGQWFGAADATTVLTDVLSGAQPGFFHAYAVFEKTEEGPPPMGIPEPATLALLGLGLAGMGFGRRKKKV